MDDIEEILSQAMVLTFRASRRIKDHEVSNKANDIGNELSKLLKEYRGDTSKLADPIKPSYGLYNDHKLEYGVQLPNKDESWTLQTK